jgi:histidinol-phosphate aminotransferase
MKEFNVNDLVRDNVKKLKPYSSARDEFKNFTQEMIYLDANENPFENGVNRYPDPQQKELKSIIASSKNVQPENLLIGNGSDEVLDLLYRAFCEPAVDNVITLPPTYGMYDVLANINNIKNTEIVLTSDFEPNVSVILNAVNTNTKMIFLCSPNNPTGNTFSDENILKLLNNFNGFVVLDEAYIDFSAKISWLQKLNNFPNLIICQTLSKAYGMAGLRVGLLFASTQVITILNKIKPPYNVNVVSQQIAIKQLNKNKVINDITVLNKEREQLLIALKNCKVVTTVYASDVNFVLVKFDDANKRYNQFLENGIVIRNRSNQPLCENCLRITIGTPEENKKVIEFLKTI